jgi:hypothetical protein
MKILSLFLLIGFLNLSASAKNSIGYNRIIFTGFDVEIIDAVLTRGPYLNAAVQDGIVIRWRTDIATDSKVNFGFTPVDLSQGMTDNTLTTEHIVTLTGLSSNTLYYYSIGSSTQILQGDASNYFRTLPVVGSSQKVRFLAMGDMGNNTPTQKNIRDVWLNFNGSNYTDGWLLLGDNAYTDGTEAEYQNNFFDIYQGNLTKNHVLWPAPGNHDYANNSGRQADHLIPYYNIFTLPTNGEAGGVASHSEAFYSYNYANIHFVALDSYGWETGNTRLYDTLGQQAVWLKQDLAANTQKWTIVYFHHPPYTKGSHNSDTEIELISMRQNIVPILERYKVDLVLNGHSHSYERSFQMNGHYGLENSFDTAANAFGNFGPSYDAASNSSTYVKSTTDIRNGIVYAVIGSSGQAFTSSPGYPHNAMAYSNISKGGALYFEVECNRLQAKWICEDGIIRDNFTILKEVNKTTETTSTSGTSINLAASWNGSYNWTTGAITQSIQVTPATNSFYSVTDNERCLTDLFKIDVMHSWVKLCPPVAGTRLPAIITGAAYQWQVNTGNGFADISDNANYNATKTASLQLINIPTSWYGYKYRCIVDGSYSRIYQLQFVANFNGNVSTAWETPGNWACGAVPDANTDVLINIGNAVVNANAVCRSVLVKPTATLTIIAGNILNVSN